MTDLERAALEALIRAYGVDVVVDTVEAINETLADDACHE